MENCLIQGTVILSTYDAALTKLKEVKTGSEEPADLVYI